MYTLQGKTGPTHHVRFPLQSTHARRTLPTDSPRTWQLFTSSHEVETSLYTQKKSWQLKTDWPSRRLGWPHSSSHVTGLESGKEVSAQWLHSYLSLLGPYHQHGIGTFKTCSWGPTYRSLTDTGGSYNLGGTGLPHSHSLTFPTSCLHFPLIAPPSLHFNQVLTTKPKYWVLNNLWPPRGLSTTRPPTIAYSYA
jgi:hypothetical protein